MGRMKIGFGMDLGTSNSAIAAVEHDRIRIFKSEKYLKDTIPSCVHYNRKKSVFVGDDALNRHRGEITRAFRDGAADAINSFIEFKRTMGTEKNYFCPNANRSFLSEELSAEVLKKLKSQLPEDAPNAAVITVPAKFRQNQTDATHRAARLAGFEYCELLQEPIAASLAYGIDAREMKGHWLVFDLGGGTFDAALMKVDGGAMAIVDTEGDNHLGGKDLDFAIVDHIILPHLEDFYVIGNILSDEQRRTRLRQALKWYAEEAKIALSSDERFDILSDEALGPDDNGRQMELDIPVTLEVFENTIAPILELALGLCEKLLRNNGLAGDELEKVILVGGQTYSQSVRRLLKERICPRIDFSADPITAVAAGAALYASTRDIPVELLRRDREKIQLALAYPDTSVEFGVFLRIEIDRALAGPGVPENVFAEIVRGDKAWSAGRTEIEGDSAEIPLLLDADKTNTFMISLYDDFGNSLPCEPDRFSIIQGLEIPDAALTHSLCVGAVDPVRDREILVPLGGLEKNSPLPARGGGKFRTQKQIRSGNREDAVKIPIYEGDPHTRTELNEWASLVAITGDDIGVDLPEGAGIEIEIEVDASMRMTLAAYLPYIDETVEVEVPENRQEIFDSETIAEMIRKAVRVLDTLERESSPANVETMNALIRMNTELARLSDLFEKGGGDDATRIQITERVREILKEIDKTEEDILWPVMGKKINRALKELSECQAKYGNRESSESIDTYRIRAKAAVEQMSLTAAKGLLKEIRAAGLEMMSGEIGLWVRYVREFYTQFDRYDWKDGDAAMKMIDRARKIIAENPSKQEIERIVRNLFDLLPESPDEDGAEYDDELLVAKMPV